MRSLVSACVLVMAAAVPAAQDKDAATVLARMRQALGGDAALDAVRTMSISGIVKSTDAGRTIERYFDFVAAFPDRFVRTVRLAPGGPVPMGITVRTGLNVGSPIFKIDTVGIQFDRLPSLASASDEAKAGAAIRRRQELARFSLVFLGKSIAVFPLEFAYVGREEAAGLVYDVIEATDENRMTMRLHVDAQTGLPAMLSFQGDRPLPVIAPGRAVEVPLALVERRWVLSEFKKVDALNWPRRLEELVGTDVVEDIRFHRIRVNPKVNDRQFEIK